METSPASMRRNGAAPPGLKRTATTSTSSPAGISTAVVIAPTTNAECRSTMMSMQPSGKIKRGPAGPRLVHSRSTYGASAAGGACSRYVMPRVSAVDDDAPTRIDRAHRRDVHHCRDPADLAERAAEE